MVSLPTDFSNLLSWVAMKRLHVEIDGQLDMRFDLKGGVMNVLRKWLVLTINAISNARLVHV